jgi:hypothetical protein
MTSTKMASMRKLVRIGFLAVFMVSCPSLVSLHAQDQPAHPAQPQPASPERKKAQEPYGPGRQLAHASNEAAGEEKDQMSEFKESASVRLIGRLTGLSLQQSYWLSQGLNFAIIAGVIVWAGFKYLPGMFRDRSTAIQKAMQEAQMASEEARRRLAEIESRLMKLDVEIAMMRDAAEKEGAAEEARRRCPQDRGLRRAGNCGGGEGRAAATHCLCR